MLRLLALLFFLQPGSAVTEYYVWSNTSAACPTESCLTFNEYVNDTETYFTSNTSFIFLEGEHYLDSALVVDGKCDITMKASTNASVTIIFSSNAVIRFQDSQAFVVSSLMIHYHGSDQYESALELFYSQNIQLTGVEFEKSLDTMYASRAVLMYNSTVSITDCSFFNGSIGTGKDGGALFVTHSTVELLGCVDFTGNSAEYGGAIAARYSTLSVYGNTAFESNTASLNAGAIVALSSDLSFSGNITFTNNSADSTGGAIDIELSHVQLLANITFENNMAAAFGGAIFVWSSYMLINGGMTFTSNSAEYGGAMAIELADVQLLGKTAFKNNSASNSGGAISVALSSNLSIHGDMTFTNNRVESNTAPYENNTLHLIGGAILLSPLICLSLGT